MSFSFPCIKDASVINWKLKAIAEIKIMPREHLNQRQDSNGLSTRHCSVKSLRFLHGTHIKTERYLMNLLLLFFGRTRRLLSRFTEIPFATKHSPHFQQKAKLTWKWIISKRALDVASLYSSGAGNTDGRGWPPLCRVCFCGVRRIPRRVHVPVQYKKQNVLCDVSHWLTS
jgi:hypothetical protein